MKYCCHKFRKEIEELIYIMRNKEGMVIEDKEGYRLILEVNNLCYCPFCGSKLK